VLPDPVSTLVPGGPSISLPTTTPGRNARATFSGIAGQRISLSSYAPTGARLSIFNPDGSYFISPSAIGFHDVRILPADGTYTIFVDPTGGTTGDISLTLYDVPPDVLATIVPGGPAVSVTTTTKGQNAKLTFDGVANRKISINVSGTVARIRISILKPDGSVYMSPFQIDGGTGFIDVRVLPVTGTYTIVVDPDSENTGTTTLTLNDVP
jgi:hypothetical protein